MIPTTKINLKGENSAQYIRFAQSQLAILERQMSFQNLNEGRRVVSPFPGVFVECLSRFGNKEVRILTTAQINYNNITKQNKSCRTQDFRIFDKDEAFILLKLRGVKKVICVAIDVNTGVVRKSFNSIAKLTVFDDPGYGLIKSVSQVRYSSDLFTASVFKYCLEIPRNANNIAEQCTSKDEESFCEVYSEGGIPSKSFASGTCALNISSEALYYALSSSTVMKMEVIDNEWKSNSGIVNIPSPPNGMTNLRIVDFNIDQNGNVGTFLADVAILSPLYPYYYLANFMVNGEDLPSGVISGIDNAGTYEGYYITGNKNVFALHYNIEENSWVSSGRTFGSTISGDYTEVATDFVSGDLKIINLSKTNCTYSTDGTYFGDSEGHSFYVDTIYEWADVPTFSVNIGTLEVPAREASWAKYISGKTRSVIGGAWVTDRAFTNGTSLNLGNPLGSELGIYLVNTGSSLLQYAVGVRIDQVERGHDSYSPGIIPYGHPYQNVYEYAVGNESLYGKELERNSPEDLIAPIITVNDRSTEYEVYIDTMTTYPSQIKILYPFNISGVYEYVRSFMVYDQNSRMLIHGVKYTTVEDLWNPENPTANWKILISTDSLDNYDITDQIKSILTTTDNNGVKDETLFSEDLEFIFFSKVKREEEAKYSQCHQE